MPHSDKANKNIDPTIWGPPFWQAIHYVALGFNPISPNVVSNYRAFYESLGSVIPCQVCAKHYNQILRTLPLTNKVLSTTSSLFDWTVAVHNHVNKEHGKRVISAEKAMEYLKNPLKYDCKKSLRLSPLIMILLVLVIILSVTLAIFTSRSFTQSAKK